MNMGGSGLGSDAWVAWIRPGAIAVPSRTNSTTNPWQNQGFQTVTDRCVTLHGRDCCQIRPYHKKKKTVLYFLFEFGRNVGILALVSGVMPPALAARRRRLPFPNDFTPCPPLNYLVIPG